eukprot:5520337-Prymnesium_polylepis.2
MVASHLDTQMRVWAAVLCGGDSVLFSRRSAVHGAWQDVPFFPMWCPQPRRALCDLAAGPHIMCVRGILFALESC